MSELSKLQTLLSLDLSTLLHLCKVNDQYKEVCKKNKKVIRDYILTTHPQTSKNIDNLLEFGDNEKSNYFLIVKTADNKEIKITGSFLEKSSVLKNMFALFALSINDKQKGPVELPFSEKTLNYIIGQKDPYNLELDTLIEIAKAANYLEIEDYLDQITTRIAEIIQKI